MSYPRILVVSNVAELELVRNAQELFSRAFVAQNHRIVGATERKSKKERATSS